MEVALPFTVESLVKKRVFAFTKQGLWETVQKFVEIYRNISKKSLFTFFALFSCFALFFPVFSSFFLFCSHFLFFVFNVLSLKMDKKDKGLLKVVLNVF